MKYNINFNQKAVIDNKWDCLTANHMVLLDCLVGSFNTRKLKTINEHGEIWYWLSVPEIIKQAPILRVKERRCRDIIKDLLDCGLVELHPNNKNLGKHYIRLGSNYQKLVYSEPMQDNANHTDRPMQNNAKTYAENCNAPMQNNADYNSINNNSINIIKKEKENASLVLFETLFSEYKKQTEVSSHKAKSKEAFLKLNENTQLNVKQYLEELFRRRLKILAAGKWQPPLQAFERFIKNKTWENVDLPELKQEEKPKQSNIKIFLG